MGHIFMDKSMLLNNLDKLSTTSLGALRIKRNLSLTTENVVEHCKNLILSPNAYIYKKGKNFYIKSKSVTITVNALTYNIITAHKTYNLI